jgi:hypothetical protein
MGKRELSVRGKRVRYLPVLAFPSKAVRNPSKLSNEEGQ